MKKAQRIGAISKILSDAPNKTFTLKYFCDLFGAAKSSLSEDVQAVRELFSQLELGLVETTSGAGGGIRYIPYISDNECDKLLQELCDRLYDKSRILGSGFLYTSDIMFDASLMRRVAMVFARRFRNSGAEYVATIETKGIPAAVMTAYMLDLPLLVIRREAKVSEGSTMSINYFSGSADHIQRMSVARRAVVPGGKVLIIDDFMRAGGSVKGISEILTESGMQIVGTGIVIASTTPEKKKIESYTPLVYLDSVDESEKRIKLFPNSQIF